MLGWCIVWVWPTREKKEINSQKKEDVWRKKESQQASEVWIVPRGRFQWRQNMCWNDQLKTKCCVINGRLFAAVSCSLRIKGDSVGGARGNAYNGCGAAFSSFSTLKNIHSWCLKWEPEIMECMRGMAEWENDLSFWLTKMEKNGETAAVAVGAAAEKHEECTTDKNVIISKMNRLHVTFNHFLFMSFAAVSCSVSTATNLRIYIPFATCDLSNDTHGDFGLFRDASVQRKYVVEMATDIHTETDTDIMAHDRRVTDSK